MPIWVIDLNSFNSSVIIWSNSDSHYLVYSDRNLRSTTFQPHKGPSPLTRFRAHDGANLQMDALFGLTIVHC
jgi:hypothetical protein